MADNNKGNNSGAWLRTIEVAVSLSAAAIAIFASMKAYELFDHHVPQSAFQPSQTRTNSPAPTQTNVVARDGASNNELTRILDELSDQLAAAQKKCKADDNQDCRQRAYSVNAFLEARIIAASRAFKMQQIAVMDDDRHTDVSHELTNPDRSQLLLVLTLAKVDLTHILPYANFSYAELNAIKAEDVSFEKGMLEHANFSHSRFDGINLEETKLAYSNFSYSILNGARLRFADLSNADLTCTDLSTADFEPTDIQGANNWQKAIFSEQQKQVLGLTQTNECPAQN